MGKKIKFNDCEINNIINKHVFRNVNCKEIGINYGVSEYTIRRLLKKNNIEINKTQFKKKYTVNENFFDEVNKVNSFFVGLMASDGNIRKNLNSFSISQSGKDGLVLINNVRKWLEYNGVVYHTKTTNKTAHSITITSPVLVKKLIEHNIIPNKSSKFYYNNKSYLNEFLQGYVEGDGCVGIYKKNGIEYYYISFFGSENFKESIISLLPIKPKYYRINDRYFELKFFGRKGIEFSNWLWENPVYSNSVKYNKFIDFKNNKYSNRKHQIYGDLNIKIINMLNNGHLPKEIACHLNINRRTIYNLKYNKKNGRNTY
jgi:hypothetical protein